MKRLLLASIALASMVPGLASAQSSQGSDVVMRRPLSSSSAGASTAPTPTPGGTATPTPGSSDPYVPITDPGTKVSTSGYGWQMDCATRTYSCHEVTYPVDGADVSDASWDWSLVGYQDAPDSACTPDQSAGAKALVYQDDDYLVPDGTPGNLDLCSGSDPQGNVSYSYYTASCGDDSKVQLSCTRYILPGAYQSGVTPVLWSLEVDDSVCAAQQKSAAWSSFASDMDITPGDPSSVGKSCSQPASYSVMGAKCVPVTPTNSQGLVCQSFLLTDDGMGHVTANPYVTSTQSPFSCENDQGYDQDQLKALAAYGYLAPSPDLPDECTNASSHALFGAVNTCVHSVTYDAGWPTPPAQAHVDDGSKTACYAIYGKDNPATMTVQPTDIANCQNQQLSDPDRQFLHTLEPDLYPYDELPQTCQTGVGSPLNYQRSNDAVNVKQTTGAAIRNGGCNDGKCLITHAMTMTFDLPYVCTDAVPGDYYGGFDTGLQSNYDMQGDCIMQRDNDVAYLQSVVTAIQGGRSVPEPTGGAEIQYSAEMGSPEYSNPDTGCYPMFSLDVPKDVYGADEGLRGVVDNGDSLTLTVSGLCAREEPAQ